MDEPPDAAGGWVVILDCAPTRIDARFELDDIDAVLECLVHGEACALYNPTRYSLQVRVDATGALDAIGVAARDQRRAHRIVDLPASDVVRAEVTSFDEFDASFEIAYVSSRNAASKELQTVVCEDAFVATRALLRATTPAATTRILAEFVDAVGGTIRVGAPSHDPTLLAIPMGVVASDHLHAVAARDSVAAMILELSLPGLVEDARHLNAQRSSTSPPGPPA